MNPISLHPILFYFLLFWDVALMGLVIYLVILWYKRLKYDYLIFIDSTNRFRVLREKIEDTNEYEYKGKKYILSENASLLNRKGRSLFVFSENKPQPMALSYNNSKWLDSASLLGVINNKLIQKLVQTSDTLLDRLMLFGAIGGMISGVATILILLKTFGILQG